MKTNYITRSLEPVLKKAARQFPAVVLTGPRQSGKTTLLRKLFWPGHRYVSMELPDVRAAAQADPRGFLDQYPPPLILDEAQHCPELLPYIKERIDAHRSRVGQYLLSGSQNLLLLERVTETLAGRAAILKLLPLSFAELAGQPQAAFPWEHSRGQRAVRTIPTSLWDQLLRGGYPEIAAAPRRDLALWQGSYIQTYLERDVRMLRQIGDLTLFQNFLRALAARSASLLNLSELARDIGVAVNTARGWLSILEATHQVVVLRPYFANIGKRLVKSPKVYFTDTGTLCYLVGLRDTEHAAAGPMAGALFETAVFVEIYKRLLNRGLEPQIYFWRTASGAEVDLLVENDGRLIPIEVKAGATPRPEMASGIRRFRGDFSEKAAAGYVIHTGAVSLPLAPGVTALPFTLL